jgi:hypothetical protein
LNFLWPCKECVHKMVNFQFLLQSGWILFIILLYISSHVQRGGTRNECLLCWIGWVICDNFPIQIWNDLLTEMSCVFNMFSSQNLYLYFEPLTAQSPVGYGRRGSPCCQVKGAQTALDALILWANLIKSSEGTGRLLALAMDWSFCLAWYIAVAWKQKPQLS